MLVLAFVLPMFLGAALLFLVEPMIAKMMLPMLGGSAGVWNTCLVFFQAMLLAGYFYAYAIERWLRRRLQIALHMALVASPLAIVGLLPLHLPAGWDPPSQSSPVFWIFALLLVSVGLPFFILSSTAPLMQRWFAESAHRGASDPYFLYAAGNAGSLCGLLAYPVLLEPLLRLHTHAVLWSYGYLFYVLAIGICALIVWRSPNLSQRGTSAEIEQPATGDTWKERLRWIALAFVPSSLMLGVTTALTTDVPAIPLLWVLSLAIYLISFILVFAKRPPISHAWLVRREPFLILAGLIPTVAQSKLSFPILLTLYLSVLFGVAMVCHGELATTRPAVRRLTEFYLCISIGGVLGGLFNALLAPLIFQTVLELPLALIFAALLRPSVESKVLTASAAVWAKRKDWLLPIALGLCMVAVIVGLARAGIRPSRASNLLIFGYSLLWCLSFARRRFRFVWGLTAVVIASFFYSGPLVGHVIHTERSFFGISRVTSDAENKSHMLIHGGTVHGMQHLDSTLSKEPLIYYTRSGPAGQIFGAVQTSTPQGNWAIVGLGAGTMACYLQPGQTLTYYEIDPHVASIAEDARYFSFLHQCSPQADIVLGDARLKLRDAPDTHYGLIVLDAFSGDSIPMHLVTREALALYQRKLAPHGIIAFHISNIYMDLGPALDTLARNAHLVCLIENDVDVSQAQIDEGKFPSIWVVMARDQSDLTLLLSEHDGAATWVPIPAHPTQRLWTDDYSNLLSAIKWN
jgi:hypothetical protein